MTKLVITESQYNRIFGLKEDIFPDEANRDESSVDTVIKGKRNVGFLPIRKYNANLLKDIHNAGLETIELIQDNNESKKAYIFYRKNFEKQAKKLANIAIKYDGYLPASPEQGITADEVYQIGRLLGYDRDSVVNFVLDKFDLRANYFSNKNIYK
jgi:hypothetical protein